jgi:LysM repeat protein
MMQHPFRKIHYVLICAICFLTACGDRNAALENEDGETQYRRGVSLLREGRNEEALQAFEKVIDKRLDAPDSHLQVGQIYLEHFKDAVMAEYHFRRYLEADPSSEKAAVVRQLIESARKEYARQLPGKPYGENGEKLDILQQIDLLRTENLELKRKSAGLEDEVNDLKAALMLSEQKYSMQQSASLTRATPSIEVSEVSTPAASVRTAPSVAQTRSPGNVTSYEVQSGDTLSKISTKVYGTPNRWKEIFEANKDSMASPNSLKVGQKLKIP